MTRLADKPVPRLPPAGEIADRRWTREEYDQLVEMGLFDGQRVQLIEGRVLQMSQPSAPHCVALELTDRYLRRAFPIGYRICIQMPFRAPDGSDPEPDVAVIVGGDPRQMKDHPSTAELVIEVADTSVSLDRRKARLYAASGVNDYWILNLLTRTLEIHREPLANALDPASPGYASIRILRPDETVAPVQSPDVSTKVVELLP